MTWIPSGQAFTYFDIIHGEDVPLAWPCDGRAQSLGLKFFLQFMQTTPAGLCNSAHSQILIVVGSGFVHLHSFPGFESGTRGKGTCLFIVVHVVRKLMIANGEVTFGCQPEAATRGSEYTGESDGSACFGFWLVKP